jgi:hypothetical protein
MPLHNFSFVMMCDIRFYFATRAVQNSNLIWIEISRKLENDLKNYKKGFLFSTMAMGQNPIWFSSQPSLACPLCGPVVAQKQSSWPTSSGRAPLFGQRRRPLSTAHGASCPRQGAGVNSSCGPMRCHFWVKLVLKLVCICSNQRFIPPCKILTESSVWAPSQDKIG